MFAVTDFFAVTAYTSFGIQHFFTPVCRANRIDTPSNAPVCYGHFRTIYARRRFSVGGPRSLISQCLSVGAYRTDGSADSNDVSWVRPGFGADKVQSDWSRTVHCHRGYTRRGAAGRRGFCVPPTFDFYRELINFRRTATVARARVRQKRFARCKKKKTPRTCDSSLSSPDAYAHRLTITVRVVIEKKKCSRKSFLCFSFFAIRPKAIVLTLSDGKISMMTSLVFPLWEVKFGSHLKFGRAEKITDFQAVGLLY